MERNTSFKLTAEASAALHLLCTQWEVRPSEALRRAITLTAAQESAK